MYNFNLPLRILQTLLSITAIALNGYVMTWYLNNTKPRATPYEAPFLIFTAAWTLFFLPYLFLNPALSQTTTGKPSGRFFNKYAVLALDLVTCCLWFAGFIALAVFENGFVSYFGLTSYSKCGGHVCTTMIGGVIVAAATSVTFVVTTALAALHVVRTRRGGDRVEREHAGWVGMQEGTKV